MGIIDPTLALHRHPHNLTLCIPTSVVQRFLEVWQPWGHALPQYREAF